MKEMNKSVVAVNLINYLIMRLKEVDEFFIYTHKKMGFDKDFVEEKLAQQKDFYKEMNEKLAEVANLLGDALDDLDAVTEDDLAITTPMFGIINKD
ncbi:hypothetical protein MWN41_05410 [Ornithobacterium rhinotracheale]|uniref:hypothetical protein n=1 Tax=Ornithobacterium rhinotracheale TaxID=28251 RepID=UPI001FF405F8|nr:hypothetical protein [Ornithobacterium rhinotracheale]MCK0202456.1 hypothetical protein [Ornithobacterium rhinotracheale]